MQSTAAFLHVGAFYAYVRRGANLFLTALYAVDAVAETKHDPRTSLVALLMHEYREQWLNGVRGTCVFLFFWEFEFKDER